MFITRKNGLEELQETLQRARELLARIEKKELEHKIDSLAKELGYEWTSEAVKERQIIGNLEKLGWEQMGEEKAVLKWGWKKINSKSK